ncbi:MAG: DUF817 domain-containing protein [Sphingobacteriales bacterium]|nr:MAG: DUF817 domain-containing protein [Sphingobacteriales bacterium]
MRHFFHQLLTFGCKQALCCVFPVAIFLSLAVTKWLHVPYRYDVILVICIAVQALMVYFKQETIDEVKVISLFHIIGLCLELFKVNHGSWAYPEFAYTKIGGVPLYSGFMYSSVASYICQAWRRFDLSFHNWPSRYVTYSIAAIIYLNFFLHHYLIDIRWYIIASLFVFFRRAYVTFYVNEKLYKMSIILSYFLIGFFIWVAENISTFFGAWQYPNQKHEWHLVGLGKMTSWFLLVIISIIIVANLKHLKAKLVDEPVVDVDPSPVEIFTPKNTE